MKSRIKRQFILALFWFASAYLAVSVFFPHIWALRCAWFNLIIGMVGLLLITRTEYGDRLFYKGPQEDEAGWFLVALIWSIPMVGFFAAILWWIFKLLGIFNW